jgi:hypothetical protein
LNFVFAGLNLEWGIWIWSEKSEFGVRDLNLEWEIWIWSEKFEFGVGNLNLEWEIWIWSGKFEFGVRDLNLEWGICSEKFEFGVTNLNLKLWNWRWYLIYYWRCTCGPPYVCIIFTLEISIYKLLKPCIIRQYNELNVRETSRTALSWFWL